MSQTHLDKLNAFLTDDMLNATYGKWPTTLFDAERDIPEGIEGWDHINYISKAIAFKFHIAQSRLIVFGIHSDGSIYALRPASGFRLAKHLDDVFGNKCWNSPSRSTLIRRLADSDQYPGTRLHLFKSEGKVQAGLFTIVSDDVTLTYAVLPKHFTTYLDAMYNTPSKDCLVYEHDLNSGQVQLCTKDRSIGGPLVEFIHPNHVRIHRVDIDPDTKLIVGNRYVKLVSIISKAEYSVDYVVVDI